MGYKKGNRKIFADLGDRARVDRAEGTRRVCFSPGSIHLHTLKAFRGSESEAPRGKRAKRQTGKRLECPTLVCHRLV